MRTGPQPPQPRPRRRRSRRLLRRARPPPEILTKRLRSREEASTPGVRECTMLLLVGTVGVMSAGLSLALDRCCWHRRRSDAAARLWGRRPHMEFSQHHLGGACVAATHRHRRTRNRASRAELPNAWGTLWQRGFGGQFFSGDSTDFRRKTGPGCAPAFWALIPGPENGFHELFLCTR